MTNGMLVRITATAVALGRADRSFDAFGSEGTVHFRGPLLGEGTTELQIGRAGDNEMVDLEPHDRMPASGVALPARRSASAIRALALMLEDWLPAFKESRPWYRRSSTGTASSASSMPLTD